MIALRLAVADDAAGIAQLMAQAIEQLQRGYLSPDQIDASKMSMGLDLQLIEDGTYFCAMEGDALAGCGGWSRRATLYGGSHSAGRDQRLLNPVQDRARIRAMYTHPAFVRRGIGAMILRQAEEAARAEGFSAMEMAATMAGKPFYLARGYTIESEWFDTDGAVAVPLATMVKTF